MTSRHGMPWRGHDTETHLGQHLAQGDVLGVVYVVDGESRAVLDKRVIKG